MKKLLIILTIISASFAYAHDEGHGPKLGDQPKFGGKVAAVIDKTEIKKGTKASLIYKAELTKNNKNILRVYLYDERMNKKENLKMFSDAEAELQYKDKKTKKWVSEKFKLEKKDGFYEGQLPSKARRPFNVDVSIKMVETVFMAFDNLN